MGVNISLFAGVGAQLFNDAGLPLAGGKIFTYTAGTSTPLATYTDYTGNIAHSNPIVLDASGRVNEIWLTEGLTYKFVVEDAVGNLIGTYDNINSTYIANDLANTSNPALGDALVGFRQANYSGNLSGSVGKTVHQKFMDYLCVHDFMTEAQITDSQSGSPTLDMTAAVQSALNTNRSIYFPQGVYLVDALLIPFGARGAVYFGDGFFHYTATQQTVIKARTAGQAHIMRVGNSGASGSDCLTFSQIRFDCDNKAAIGIDATYGAFFTMMDCGVYNYTSYGVYNKQGLARYDRVFMNTSPTTHPGAVGLHLYSDSAVTDSEFSGGGIPLKIVAGGNRLVNIWANTGAAACITLTPFDNSTTHINTSMVNVYAGEVLMTAPSGVRPIIEMVGTAVQKVQEVQFSNSYLVTAAGDTYKKNGGIYMDYCDAVAISNIVIRGNGLGGSANLYCDYFVKAQRSKTISITGCVIKDVNRNPIYLVSNIDQPVIVDGCQFYNWAVDGNASGAEYAAVRCETGTGAIVTNCMFQIDTGSAGPYAADVPSAGSLTFENNAISYANSFIVKPGTGTAAYTVNRGGNINVNRHNLSDSTFASSCINNSGRNYSLTDEFASAGSGVPETYNMTTLSNQAVQQVYLVSISQQGSGIHTAMYYVNVYGANAASVRIAGDDAVPGVNALEIQMSGLTMQAVIGSGYGVITFRWYITRLG